ncbi:MAG: tRNA 2-selenouridine(34) synthase MnmH [Bacteroidota bacterium]
MGAIMQAKDKKIEVAQLWSMLNEYRLMDVRTPAEYNKGHIPQAGTLPLFNDGERIIVGTTYKKDSPKEAFLKGLDLVAPKMTSFIKDAEAFAPDKKLILHCWRGGRRSGSMAWLLDMAGFDVYAITGGYKAYRNFILQQFTKRPLQIVVLGGRTGCGKTHILQALRAAGEQVLDLEGLANHKGSAFGALGEAAQPSVEQFENDMYEQFRHLDANRRVWVENESRSIGRIYIPQGFWDQMRSSPLINLELSLELRVENLVSDYAQYSNEELGAAFMRIRKRLGGLRFQQAIEALEAVDYHQAAAIALAYYDKSYQYMLDNHSSPDIHNLPVDHNDPQRSAELLINYCAQNQL